MVPETFIIFFRKAYFSQDIIQGRDISHVQRESDGNEKCNHSVCSIPKLNRHDAAAFVIICLASMLINFSITFKGWLPFDADTLLFFYPLRSLHSDPATGFWDSYMFCGFPRDANPQSQILYLPNLIFQVFSTHAGYILMLIGHYILGGVFMYVFLRGTRLSPFSALFGALAFLLSTFWRCKVTNLGLLEGQSWLPALLYFYVLSLDRKWWIPSLAAAISFSMIILAGVPHTVVYSFTLVLMITIVFGFFGDVPFKTWLSSLFTFLAASALLTIGTWLPALLYAPETQRTMLQLNEALAGSLGWNEIWRVILGGLSQPDISRADPWEGTCYLGATALFFIPLGWRYMAKPLRYSFTLASLFALLCTLGREGGLYVLLYNYVPGWNFLNLPNRSLILLAVSLPIFVGFGLEKFLSFEYYTQKIKIILKMF